MMQGFMVGVALFCVAAVIVAVFLSHFTLPVLLGLTLGIGANCSLLAIASKDDK